jgi:AraC-like DNA-binding protein
VLALAVALGRIAIDLTGRPVTRRLDVTFAAPAYYHRLADLLPPEVRFGQPRTRLVFEAGALAQPIRPAEPGAAAVERVRALLIKPDRGVRSIEEVARLLRTSTRTLRRQLAVASTTFSDLTAARRHEIARLMLADRRCSIGAIADRLGYSDVPNFTRAFKRWTGTTPAQFRAALHVTVSGAPS